ncbi:STAS domain-containing protein [Virgibacillus xinjiangensis]|uniref:STAS domain-containing protein n=1 Tax=Virgibacillus xinjiangensis TaxID=393090 RepID=A0ABV7CV40_9BACI
MREKSFEPDNDMKEFFLQNREDFEKRLLSEAVNVRDKIEEIKLIGNINLIENAHKLALYVVEQKEQEVVDFAKQEGIAWAKNQLTLAFKLEWVQTIRRTMWYFLSKFDEEKEKGYNGDQFYEMEYKINSLIDEFFKGFFIHYSKYKDELIESQRELVDNLSVPIIPISSSVSILPLIGTIDPYRATIIEEKVLVEVGKMRVGTLIMDLSGIAEMDIEATQHFLKLLDGLSMMGCRAVVTGLRPEVVTSIQEVDMDFSKKVEARGTLQKALENYFRQDISEQTGNITDLV